MTQQPQRLSRLSALIDRFEPLRILRRRWFTFGATAASVVGLAIVGYILSQPKYSATGSILVSDAQPGVTNNAPISDLKVGDPADMESQLIVVRSQRVMRRALSSKPAQDALNKECNAAGGKGFDGSCANLSSRVGKLVEYASDRYSVAGVGRSRVISVSYTSADPEVAANMANALITAFIEDQKEAVAQSRREAADLLSTEASRLDSDIKKLDDEIVEFRTSNGLVRGANGPFSAERLSSMGQELGVAQAAQAASAAQLKELNAARTGGSASSTAALESRTIGDLKQRLTEIQVDMANAEATLGPAHPRWKALSDQERMVRSQMQAEVDRLTRSVQKQYDAATERVNLLTRQMQAGKVDVANSVVAERDIESKVRDVEVMRKKYADIRERINVLEAEQRIITGNVSEVSPAEAPLKPFFPKLVPFLAAGLMLGLILGFVTAFLVDQIFGDGDEEWVVDSEYEDAPAGEGPTEPATVSYSGITPPGAGGEGARLAAVMPQLHFPAANGHPGQSLFAALNATAGDPKAVQALESLMRAAAPFDAHTRFGASLLFTSPTTGGGKTLTSLALARHVAAKGRSVVVIECNRASPLISDAMGLPANYNWDAPNPASLIIHSPFPKFDIVACGRSNAILAPAEWDRRLLRAMDWAMRHYNLVILDGAPYVAPDTARLIGYANGVALCARESELQSDAAIAAIAGIQSAGHIEVAIVASAAAFGAPAQTFRPQASARR